MALGNSPGAPTGYGGQAMYMILGAIAAGFDVVCLPWNLILNGAMGPGIPVFNHGLVKDKFSDITKHFKPEHHAAFDKHVLWVSNPFNAWPVGVIKSVMNEIICATKCSLFIAFHDIFVYQSGPFACPSAVWMPLHFIPIEHKTIESLCSFDMHVAMTHWGQDQLNTLFGKPLLGPRANRQSMIYHGRDLKTFSPLPGLTSPLFRGEYLAERNKLRATLKLPEDVFLIVMVAAYSESSNRKALDAQIQGVVRFMQSSPLKTHLHIHSGNQGEFDIARILEIFGEFPKRYPYEIMWEPQFPGKEQTAAYTFVHPESRTKAPRVTIASSKEFMGLTEAEIADLYRAADVAVIAACSEGFGVPIIEAQLCGCPVVTNAITSMPELTFYGMSVPPSQWTVRADFNSGWYVPSAANIERALVKISNWSFEDRVAMFAESYPKLTAAFDSVAVTSAWTAWFESIKTKDCGTPAQTPLNAVVDTRPEIHRALYEQFSWDRESKMAEAQMQYYHQQLVLVAARQVQRDVLRGLIDDVVAAPVSAARMKGPRARTQGRGGV